MDVLRISLVYITSINFQQPWASHKQEPLSPSSTSLNYVLTATSSIFSPFLPKPFPTHGIPVGSKQAYICDSKILAVRWVARKSPPSYVTASDVFRLVCGRTF